VLSHNKNELENHKGISNMTKVKLAVIGAGNLAQSQHIPNLCMARNAELHTLCDIRKDVITSLGEYYGIENIETDHRNVLANPEIDGVIIATREDSHVPLTLEALAAGKHVYVEKPLAETEDACKQVIDAQKNAGKLVAVGMNRRRAPAYLYAKELLWKNGGPKNMFYRIADSYCLDWGKAFGENQRVVHEVCHIFDILRFFANSEVKSIYAMKARSDDEQFCLQFESGTIATILSSGYVRSDMPKEHFEAIAAEGSVLVDDFVEVRRFSFDEGDAVKSFAGHYHPQYDIIHAGLFKELGADALYAVRRTSWKMAKRHAELLEKNETDTLEFRKLDDFIKNHMPLRNYCMNKGWLDAVEHFCDCIITDSELKTATAFDGLQASKITQAAIKSRKTGEITYIST